MADWQLKLANLTGLTDEQKEDAEIAITSIYVTTQERNFFLRGSGAEAWRRVSKLLAKGKNTGYHGQNPESHCSDRDAITSFIIS